MFITGPVVTLPFINLWAENSQTNWEAGGALPLHMFCRKFFNMMSAGYDENRVTQQLLKFKLKCQTLEILFLTCRQVTAPLNRPKLDAVVSQMIPMTLSSSSCSAKVR